MEKNEDSTPERMRQVLLDELNKKKPDKKRFRRYLMSSCTRNPLDHLSDVSK